MSRHQNVGQDHNSLIANKSFEEVTKFKHLRTIITNHNYIHEEITIRLNPGNACYHSVWSLLSSNLLIKNLRIKTYKTIFYLLFCMGVKLGLTLREECV
jgi:hypothetical protein